MKKHLAKMQPDDFSAEIAILRDYWDEMKFRQLTKLAICVMSFPHLNAKSERVFAIVTDRKNKKGNRMGSEIFNRIYVTRVSMTKKCRVSTIK